MAVTLLAKIKTKAGSEAPVESAFREMIAKVRAEEPSTLTYVLHKAENDPTTFWFYEVYTDQAAFDAHSKSANMKELVGKIGPHLDGRPELHMLQEIARK